MTHSSESGNAAHPVGAQAAKVLPSTRIVDARGTQASVVSLEQAGSETLAWIRAGDGPALLVPLSLMTQQPDGTYRLPFAFDASPGTEDNLHATLEVRQEQLHVGKRVVDRGSGVRIHKTVSEHEQVVDQPLLRDELGVEHVPVGAVVDQLDPPRMRYEGDTLVVPVLEEVLVVQKQLRLKEEVRITRHRREVHAPQTVSLRSEHISVERFDEDVNGEGGGQA